MMVLWYLDRGATNHMTGRLPHKAFVNIDTTIRGSVRCGDGMKVDIDEGGCDVHAKHGIRDDNNRLIV